MPGAVRKILSELFDGAEPLTASFCHRHTMLCARKLVSLCSCQCHQKEEEPVGGEHPFFLPDWCPGPMPPQTVGKALLCVFMRVCPLAHTCEGTTGCPTSARVFQRAIATSRVHTGSEVLISCEHVFFNQASS